jgi:hypothetical protein
MANLVQELRAAAEQIRSDNESQPYPTAALDSELLDRAANEIVRLHQENNTLKRGK